MLLAATDYAVTKFKLCYFMLCFQMVFCFNFELNYLKIQRSVHCNNNKPRTAKVGAISKAENCKRGDPSGFVELQLVTKYENLKGGLLGDFKTFQ